MTHPHRIFGKVTVLCTLQNPCGQLALRLKGLRPSRIASKTPLRTLDYLFNAWADKIIHQLSSIYIVGAYYQIVFYMEKQGIYNVGTEQTDIIIKKATLCFLLHTSA